MKESSVSPEIAEKQSLLMDLQSAIKFSRLYPPEHPLLKKALQKTVDNLTRYLAVQQQLRLRIRLAEIYSGPSLINKNHEVLEQWAQNLYTLGIQELVFYEGASEAEILKFIVATGLSEDAVTERGGIESIWEQDEFNAIRINLTLKAEIQRILSAFAAPELTAQPDLPSQALSLLDYLGGGLDQLGGGGTELLDQLLDRPEHLSEVLLTSAQSQGDFGKTSSTLELAQFLIPPLTRIAEVLQSSPSELKIGRFQRLARVVNQLDGDLKKAVISGLATNSAGSSDGAAPIPDSFYVELGETPADQTEAVTGREGIQVKASLATEALRDAPSLAPPEAAQLEPSLVEGAVNSGFGPILEAEDILNLQRQDLVQEDQISDMTSFSPLELKIIEDSFQSAGDPGTDESFWETSAKMILLLRDPASLIGLGNSLRKRMQFLLQQNEFSGFALGLRKIGELANLQDLPEEMSGQLRQISREMMGQATRHQLLEAIRGAEKSDSKVVGILDYLSLLSSDALEDLLDWLEIEEQRWLRRAICQLLAQIGPGSFELLWRRLSSPHWYAVRNVLSVLGMINDIRSIPYMIPLVHHAHPQVRKEALKSLGVTGDPSVFEAIVEACKDPEEQVKIVAVECFGLLKDPRAKSMLFEILQRRSFFMEQVDLKKAAIQALTVLGDVDAIPLLDRLTRRPWLAFSSRHQEISLEAHKALEMLRKKRLHDHRTQSQLSATAD
jgi:hypothetical protein